MRGRWIRVALGGGRGVRAGIGVMLVGSLLASCAGIGGVGPGTGAAATGSPSVAGPGRPSIVLILTDDQRWDTLGVMPIVQARLASRGVTFSNAFVVNPLCCPSRATVLTGRYSHGTAVWTNAAPNGGFSAFHDRRTVATQLQSAGYHTALVGKYLNQYRAAAHRGYVPPGWDRWVAFAAENRAYYNYDLTIDGRIRHHGTAPSDYSTDVLADQAISFIRRTRGPLFLYFAPSAPHGPFTPAPGDVDAFAGLPPYRPPTFGRTGAWDGRQSWHPLRWSASRAGFVDRARRLQLAALLDVDRSVGKIVDALSATGRLSNTLIVFMSDNGFMWGEHDLFDKQVPYEESIRVPMVIRYDALPLLPRVDDHLVLNLDIGPTFANVAGVMMPGVAGHSLLPLLSNQTTPWRQHFLVEHAKVGGSIPSYCAVRNTRWMYVRYDVGLQELYDLRSDPYELTNLASNPHFGRRIASMRAEADRMCRPRPPGF